MAFTKLTEKYLPAFIFIIDSIRKEEIEVDYRAIADHAVQDNQSIDERTIQRAFELREKFEGKFNGARLHRTSKRTLNFLTSYYLEDPGGKFLHFSRDFAEKINNYYLDNKPEQELIDEVFNPKINHIINQRQNYLLVLNELNEKSLDEFLGDANLNIKQLEENDSKKNKFKSYLLEHLEIRIKELEDKLHQAKSIYKKFGALGLFFVKIDYDMISKESILNDFIEFYLDLNADDEILEDLI